MNAFSLFFISDEGGDFLFNVRLNFLTFRTGRGYFNTLWYANRYPPKPRAIKLAAISRILNIKGSGIGRSSGKVSVYDILKTTSSIEIVNVLFNPNSSPKITWIEKGIKKSPSDDESKKITQNEGGIP
ncbi:unnamed protein product [marine sediment metagenome]|uniref:Uncharacterized protein n=1 Tax=marine sediment metagenome TaxID=412755 RepID=X1EGG7_9ZZZZ